MTLSHRVESDLSRKFLVKLANFSDSQIIAGEAGVGLHDSVVSPGILFTSHITQ